MHIEPLIEAAHAGGKILKNYFGQILDITVKSNPSDFKTRADDESEQAVIEVLTKHFPDYNILGEESGTIDKGSEYTFVIDPLDGTNNFVLGIPTFCVSIGLIKGDEIIAGVIYAPMLDLTFSAQIGEGAFCNETKIQVSSVTEEKNGTISLCGYYGISPELWGSMFKNLAMGGFKRVMNQWCPTYDFCMLASGKIESMVNYGSELYDFCAGKIIAREAGAVITNLDGTPEENDRNRMFMASNNNQIQQSIIQSLKFIK